MKKKHIRLKLYATLSRFMPSEADNFAIKPGTTIREVLEALDIPHMEAKLIFVDGLKKNIDDPLKGGEQVGIFPPVGGG